MGRARQLTCERLERPVDGLYERMAAMPGGELLLAAARLGLRVEHMLWDAGAEVPVRRWRRWRFRDVGTLRVDEVAELLHASGYELEIRLVPAGEPRRKALSNVPESWRADWDNPEDSVYDDL